MSHINRSKKNAIFVFCFWVGGISYRERGKVLTPASFAMASQKTKEECNQELYKRSWLSMIKNKNQLQTSHCVQDDKINSMLL